MLYLGIFGLQFKNNIVIFEISTFEFVKNEFLTHTMDFGIGSAFSKGPGSAFSQGQGPGLGYFIKYANILLDCRTEYFVLDFVL